MGFIRWNKPGHDLGMKNLFVPWLEFRFRKLSQDFFCTHLDTIVWNWFFIEQKNWCLSEQDNVILHRTAEESQKENILWWFI